MMHAESNLPAELEDLIRSVIGAAIEVHRGLGPGFLERIYEQALYHELGLRQIGYERQREVMVQYKGIAIPGQRLDLLVGGMLIVELKAIDQLLPIYKAQALSYLRSTGLRAGLLINFNVKRLKDGIRRIIL